jgi:hypothetical protein
MRRRLTRAGRRSARRRLLVSAARSSLALSTVDRFVPADLFGVVIEERADVRIGGRTRGEAQRDLRQRAVGRALRGADRRPVIEGNFIGVGADGVAPLGNNFGLKLGLGDPGAADRRRGLRRRRHRGRRGQPGSDAGRPAPPIGLPTVEDDPRRPECVVPKIKLVKAKKRLTAAGYGAGKVTKPMRRRGKGFRWSSRSSLRAGTVREEATRIGLTLKYKRVKPRRARPA